MSGLDDVVRANVRTAMRLQGINQTTLAARCRRSHHWANKVLTNPRGGGMTLDTVALLATALDVPASMLVTPGGVARSRAVRRVAA